MNYGTVKISKLVAEKVAQWLRKNTWCSYKGAGSYSQQTHGSSQSTLTPVPRDLSFLFQSTCYRHSAHTYM